MRSLVAAPLLDSEGGCPGMIVLNSRVHVRRFSEQDMEELVFLAAAAAMRIRNPAGEEYGLTRLLELGRAQARNGVRALAEALQVDLDTFASGVPFGDDRTFVMLRRLP